MYLCFILFINHLSLEPSNHLFVHQVMYHFILMYIRTFLFQTVPDSHMILLSGPSLGSYPQSRRCSSRRCRKSRKPTKGSRWRTRSCCGNCTMAFHLETPPPFPAPPFHLDDLWPWTSIDFLSLLWVTCTVFRDLTSLFPETAAVRLGQSRCCTDALPDRGTCLALPLLLPFLFCFIMFFEEETHLRVCI